MPKNLRTIAYLIGCAAMLICPATHADDVAEEIEDIRGNFYEQAVEAREDYRNELRRHARIAVSKLEKVATGAIREGNLPAATKAWKQVLWLDRENRKAVAHFKTIGTLDKVLKELEEEPALPTSEAGGDSADTNQLAKALAGTVWSWGEDRSLVLSPGGLATVSDDPKPNTRRWWVAPDGNVHLYTTPAAYYEILRFDPKAGKYGGAVFKLQMQDKTGKRLR